MIFLKNVIKHLASKSNMLILLVICGSFYFLYSENTSKKLQLSRAENEINKLKDEMSFLNTSCKRQIENISKARSQDESRNNFFVETIEKHNELEGKGDIDPVLRYTLDRVRERYENR